MFIVVEQTGDIMKDESSLHIEYLFCEVFLQYLSTIPSNIIRTTAVNRVMLELAQKDTNFTSAIALGMFNIVIHAYHEV